MTSLDEAIRALEKKWRVESDRRTALAVDMEYGAPDDAGWNHGIAAGMDECADELAALLTTRQEVAPVADAVEVLRQKLANDEDGWRALCVVMAALPTAHTSEARDGRAIRSKAALLFFDKLRETSDVHEADASVGIFDASWHCGSSGLSAALNVALDAAMRQEAE